MSTKAKTTKACKAMKKLGYPGTVVRPVLKELLKLYDNKWTHIEEEGYRVLVLAILDSERPKVQSNKNEEEDEDEDDEPLLKRYKRTSHTNKSSTPNCSNDVENKSHGKQKMPEFIYETLQDEDIELEEHNVPKDCRGKQKTSASPSSLVMVEQAKEAELISEDENDDFYSGHDFSDRRIITYERGRHTPLSKQRDRPTVLLLEHSYDNAKGNCSISPEVIDLDEDDKPPRLLLEDACPKEKISDVEENNSKSMTCKQSEAQENDNDAQDLVKLDIASSSGGEVKISLMVKSSLRSDFHVPNLEALLKHVDKQCLKLNKTPQTGFSMMNLMKEVCEGFLAAATTLKSTVNVRDVNAKPSGGVDQQLNLFSKSTISNEPIRIRNLFQVTPQIPRSVGSIYLNLSCCKISLSVDVNGSNARRRNILELDPSGPSSSKTMINYIDDIAKGHEPYEISLINEVNEERGPTFDYITKNVIYQNANTRICLAGISEENCCSNCFGDCLAGEIPCICVGKNGGEFAYRLGGLLKEKFLECSKSMNDSAQQLNLFYCQDCPLQRANGKNLSGKCKGHIMRKFIKECWYKCGCNMKCGNRVVQKGISAKLQVFMTREQKGWGLRTLEDIPKGAFICEYVGEVVTYTELFERKMQTSGDKHSYPFVLDAGWNSGGVLKDEEALFTDATFCGNVARFINHRCFDANLVAVPVEVETPDHLYYHLAFFTSRKVNAMEELTWDYGIEFNDDQPANPFDCYCWSKLCRDRKSVERSRSDT